MKYFCNPVNITYAYQFKKDQRDHEKLTVNREAADPSMITYKGKYYIFASMTGAVWVSEDMASWESHPLPCNLPIYDYAPDVRVIGDWIYFTASKRDVPCSFFRTKDPVNGPYEEIKGVMDYWDPNLFPDDDGRVYFYWGCSNNTPIWGVELHPDTLLPMGEKVDLIFGNPWENGYERIGENHAMTEITPADMPYIEGAWMTKYRNKYYLQYACPGTEINGYGDGVYVGDSPLGPFTQASNNPFSYKPGGFMTGAGHGSTMKDLQGRFWHTATMRISKNHIFERRVGIWPAGFDEDGTLFCNQRYGDWPMRVDFSPKEVWKNPEWMLLSYNADMTASGCAKDHPASCAADENVQTWWKADTNESPWLMQDLGEAVNVFAVQINFADDPENVIECPGKMIPIPDGGRFIDQSNHRTCWLLEGSLEGKNWFTLEDKRKSDTDLPHDLLIFDKGKMLRYLRLTITEVPYGVCPSISGLRTFGTGNGEKPEKPVFLAERITPLDMVINVEHGKNTVGYNILWGNSPEKLYHSFMVFGECRNHRIGALVAGQNYYVRIDAFNKVGITSSLTSPIHLRNRK